jgi:ERCC4-type nuclease
MEINIDDREQNVLMIELAEMDIHCVPKRLECGDYVSEELGVCIERKSIDDFCLSIMDKRIENQCEKMIKKYKHNYVLIAGRIGDRTTSINENCILGMITKIIVEYKINVICVDNEKQLAYVLKRLLERHQKNLN